MNIFTNKSIFKKIIIVLVFMLLFSFCYPKKVHALGFYAAYKAYEVISEEVEETGEEIKETLKEFADKLLIGIANLFYVIFDGLHEIISNMFIGGNPAVGVFGEDYENFQETFKTVEPVRTYVVDEDTGEMKLVKSKDIPLNEAANDLGVPDWRMIIVRVCPEMIIRGELMLTDPNIFRDITNPEQYYDYTKTSVEGKKSLREVIAGWYYAVRNLAIVALLSVLVYVAIRMTLSTVSSDKAKYKMMFKDWLIALCLVFAIHFMMAGILNISSLITDAIGRNGSEVPIASKAIEGINYYIGEAEKRVGDGVGEQVKSAFGYICLYAAIVVFTVIFLVKYVIRSVTITFLTLIAPITCITYPIDKIGDGKSQAFNFWFKEYLFEVIIQPFHLLLYTVLITASYELASSNMLYSILCFAIMIPAEKFIKQMFGIDEKLGAPLGALAAGTAAVGMIKSAAKSIGGSGKKSGGSDNSKDDSSEKSQDSLPPRERGSLDDYDDGRESNNDNGGNNRLSRGNNEQSDENNQLSRGNENSGNNQGNLDDSNQQLLEDGEDEYEEDSAQRRMLDAEYEDYGNPDYDPHEEGYLENDFSENQPKYNGTEDERREELEESFREQGLNDEEIQQEMDKLGFGKKENDKEEQNENLQENRVPIQRQPRPVSRLQSARNAVRSEIARDVRKKYGTTKAKGVAKKVGKKAGKLALKGAAKTLNAATRLTLAAGAAGVLGMAALATGSPKTVLGAIGAGAALGNATGRRINNVRSNVNSKIGSYAGQATKYVQAGVQASRKNNDSARKKAKSQYMQDQKERDYVTQRLKDKNGTVPSYKQVNAEMEERWKYREAGITDRKVIDGARDLEIERENQVLNERTNEQIQNFNSVEDRLGDSSRKGKEYREAYEELNRGNITSEEFDSKFGEGSAEQAKEHQNAKNIAERRANQSLFAASIADQYKAADFRDEKKMKQLQETYVQDFMDAKSASGRSVSREYATEVVNSAINDAAKIRGLQTGANLAENREYSARNTTSRPDQSNSSNGTQSNNNRPNNSSSSNNNAPRDIHISRRPQSTNRDLNIEEHKPANARETVDIPVSKPTERRENVQTSNYRNSNVNSSREKGDIPVTRNSHHKEENVSSSTRNGSTRNVSSGTRNSSTRNVSTRETDTRDTNSNLNVGSSGISETGETTGSTNNVDPIQHI